MRISEPYTLFPRKFPSGTVVYYYQFRREDGSRSAPKSTGCKTLASAKKFCNKLYNQGDFNKSISLKFKDYTKDFFSEKSRYYKWKIANKEHISFETLLAYNKFLKNELLPYFAEYHLDKIKRATVKEWVIWANDRWSAKTVNSAQTVLNIIFKQAIDDELLENNPCYNISFRDIEKKHRELLTINEAAQMYQKGNWWYDNQLIFLLDIITGLRISELVALQNDDIFENYLRVNKSYSRNFGMGQTKNQLNRFVPIPSELAKELHSNNKYLFVNHEGKNKGQPLNINSFYTNLCDVYKSFGIDKELRGLDVHTNRNFYITYLQSEGVPQAKIRAVVGHKDATMTGLYTYWTPDMFEEVYQAQKKLFKLIRG